MSYEIEIPIPVHSSVSLSFEILSFTDESAQRKHSSNSCFVARKYDLISDLVLECEVGQTTQTCNMQTPGEPKNDAWTTARGRNPPIVTESNAHRSLHTGFVHAFLNDNA